MWTPSASTSPAATYSMTEVEQPHSGWMRKSAPGCSSRTRVMSDGRMPAWTWHSPSQTCIERPIDFSTYAPRNMSGPKRISASGAVLAQDVLDDGDGVRRGHAVVGQRLDLGRRVDVHDRDRAGMLRLPGAQLLGGDRVGERAARVEVGDQDGLLGREDRGGLGHEVHAAEGDDVGVGGGRLAAEAERVADVVGDVLDLGELVVVGEDDRVALAGERAHLVLQRAGRPRGRAAAARVGLGAMGRFTAAAPGEGRGRVRGRSA